MALSNAFLNGTILFSGISPDFGQMLREELFCCFKYIHIPYSELMNMPTRDRKYYIKKHNEVTNAANDSGTKTLSDTEMQNLGML